MLALRVLGRVFAQSLEVYYSALHQNIKALKILPICRQYCVHSNTPNMLCRMHFTRRLKELYQECMQKGAENSRCFICKKHLPFVCVGGPGLIYVQYQVRKYWNSCNLHIQAFCSRLDPVSSVSNYESAVLHNTICRQLMNILCSIRYVIRLFFRAVRLNLTFWPILFLYPFALLSERLRQVWWNLFLFAVEISGPAFIKFGQWASTRRDLFSDEFCDKFSILHHHARSHSWKHTVAKLMQAYGKDWRSIFVIFENNAKPVGSGCIAQVYKAYIREDHLPETFQDKLLQDRLMEENLNNQTSYAEGIDISSTEEIDEDDSIFDDEDSLYIPSQPESSDIPDNVDTSNLIPVAVKVLHPNVHAVFNRDLVLMRVMSRLLQSIVPSLRWVSLVECVDEFAISMKKQMNLISEARCMERFYDNFSESSSVRIPRPIWPLVRRDVLVESFEEGEPISKFLKDESDHPAGLREKLAQLGVDALLQMVFVDNFVHGDLHPGNILVQRSEDFGEKEEEKVVLLDVLDTTVTTIIKVPSPIRLVFLDCGITASLSGGDLEKFTEVFTAVVKGEGETVAELFLRKTAVMDCEDEKQFIKDMAHVVNKARGATIKLSQINVAELLSEVFGVLAKHHVKMESNFAMIILAIGVLEGLGRSLDPNIDILEKARPVLLRQAMRL
ncbi:uncharacterized aarF domain-containing protein kinase 2-like [Gigantopelta aegis]|uniref:uncharacterized aarF domain-containing protein kinase 2-like n=1 Tax=Gigantopelta aegis TaxID=1735272 RepID=UPI001B88BFCD|nr:uncharacterized aarF domain-containing protein kinase 2-like [Gigantopelta aegis]